MVDDNSTAIMKIEKLNGQNYTTWKYNMKIVLMDKGLWGFIDGEEKPPLAGSPAATKSAFKSRSDKAYSQIALAVEKSVQIHIQGTTVPKEAWEILQKQFSFVSVTQIVRLTRKFYAATMEENADLQKHLTYMATVAQQLRELDEEISSQKFATAVLGSLPSSYDTFITSLNARNADDLDWDSIKGALIEEEMKRKERSGGNGDEALFTAPQRGGGNQHGGGRRSSSQQRSCFNCNQYGHIARNCPYGGGNNNNSSNINVNLINLKLLRA